MSNRDLPHTKALLQQAADVFAKTSRSAARSWCINPQFDRFGGGHSPGQRPLRVCLREHANTLAQQFDRFDQLSPTEVGQVVYHAIEDLKWIAQRQRESHDRERNLPPLGELDALIAVLKSCDPVAPQPPQMGFHLSRPRPPPAPPPIRIR